MRIEDEQMACTIGRDRGLPLIARPQAKPLLRREARWRRPRQTGKRKQHDHELGISRFHVSAGRGKKDLSFAKDFSLKPVPGQQRLY